MKYFVSRSIYTFNSGVEHSQANRTLLFNASGDQALALLRELVAETGSSLLMVTHSARIASHLDRTLQLERGRLGGAAVGQP